MLNIVFAELIEGNYVLYQGDLSTDCVGKAQKLAALKEHLPAIWPGPGK
jgi:hypothetical protein